MVYCSLTASPGPSPGPALRLPQAQIGADVVPPAPSSPVRPTTDVQTTGGDQDDAISGMGQEAAARYMKAKLRVLQEELEAALREGQQKESQISDLRKQLTKVEGSSSKLQNVEKTLQVEIALSYLIIILPYRSPVTSLPPH